jgi:hypothetical protein
LEVCRFIFSQWASVSALILQNHVVLPPEISGLGKGTMKGKLVTLVAAEFLLFSGSAFAADKTARFNLYEMDCVECADDVYDIMTHQAGFERSSRIPTAIFLPLPLTTRSCLSTS